MSLSISNCCTSLRDCPYYFSSPKLLFTKDLSNLLQSCSASASILPENRTAWLGRPVTVRAFGRRPAKRLPTTVTSFDSDIGLADNEWFGDLECPRRYPDYAACFRQGIYRRLDCLVFRGVDFSGCARQAGLGRACPHGVKQTDYGHSHNCYYWTLPFVSHFSSPYNKRQEL